MLKYLSLSESNYSLGYGTLRRVGKVPSTKSNYFDLWYCCELSKEFFHLAPNLVQQMGYQCGSEDLKETPVTEHGVAKLCALTVRTEKFELKVVPTTFKFSEPL